MKKKLNVYLVVDEEDKESLIKNIKAVKAPLLIKRRNRQALRDESVDVTKDKKMIKAITIITTAITIIIDRIVII